MEIRERDGLVLAVASSEEIKGQEWLDLYRSVDIVRLREGDHLGEEERSRHGFITRPQWVNWWCRLADSEADFVADLTATERRNIRLGRKAIRDDSLRIEVRECLTERTLDQFLTVYDEQVSGMPRGKNYAARFRDEMLSNSTEYVTVCTYSGTSMEVGSIWWMRPHESVLQMRFSAARPDARSGRVMRTVYLDALQYARENGYEYGSLGNDPSLFGHIVQPGLFNFKSRLGFTPVPAGTLAPQLAGVFTEKVMSLRSLSDPSLVTSLSEEGASQAPWPQAIENKKLDLIVLTGGSNDESSSRSFRADGFNRKHVLTVR